MSFLKIAQERQSCRKYDEMRQVEKEKLLAILEAARLAPSACNGQPYHLTVCTGEKAKAVAQATAFLFNSVSISVDHISQNIESILMLQINLLHDGIKSSFITMDICNHIFQLRILLS